MRLNKELLSICCLGYNHALFLKDTLDSIQNINYDHIEVIVVDDGSKDNSVEILQQLKDNYSFPIEIIAQENTGNIGKNLNNALRKTKGTLVTFIALDDVFHSKSILLEIEMMLNNSKLAFVASSKAVSIDKDGIVDTTQPTPLTLNTIQNPSITELLELEFSEFGSFYIQGTIFRKELIEKINAFDEDMTGDDIVLRTKLFRYLLEDQNWAFKIIQENNVFYRLHDNNIHKNNTRQLKIVTEYLGKYWADRPNPKILIDWACYMITQTPLNDALAFLNSNPRAKSLLDEVEVSKTISNIQKKKDSPFSLYVYSKERIGHQRNITLFYFIKFSYTREKSKKRNNQPKIHYSQF